MDCSATQGHGQTTVWRCFGGLLAVPDGVASPRLSSVVVAILIGMGAFGLASGFGWSVIGTALAKVPPVAQPMYLSAQANLITGNPAQAIKPLSHLANADPTFADVQNALAASIFAASPDQHARAFEHARRAVELAPGVPQFSVTFVLTNRRHWKVLPDGTARLTRSAARRLGEAATKLARQSDRSAEQLTKILQALRESAEAPEFPFELPTYAQLVRSPKLLITRPGAEAFTRAQKAIAEKILALQSNIGVEKKAAQEAEATARN